MSETMIESASRLADTDLPHSLGRDHVEAAHAPRRPSTHRIRIVNAVQSTVGAYLSPAQIEDVATAVMGALRLEA